MPALDIYHNQVRNALVKDGWDITDDPYTIKTGKRDLFIDLAAQNLLAARKEGQLIAVEIKSFVSRSEVLDLENALGQFVLYHDLLLIQEPERILYLAVTKTVFNGIFAEPIGQVLLENKRLRLIVFDPKTEEILEWIT